MHALSHVMEVNTDALIWTFMAMHQKFQIQLHFRGNPVQVFPSPWESRNISFHHRGNPATLASIPMGFPRIPMIPNPVQVSNTKRKSRDEASCNTVSAVRDSSRLLQTNMRIRWSGTTSSAWGSYIVLRLPTTDIWLNIHRTAGAPFNRQVVYLFTYETMNWTSFHSIGH